MFRKSFAAAYATVVGLVNIHTRQRTGPK